MRTRDKWIIGIAVTLLVACGGITLAGGIGGIFLRNRAARTEPTKAPTEAADNATPTAVPTKAQPTEKPATPTPTTQPTEVVYAQGNAERDGNAVNLFVLNPEAETQRQDRHPTVYEETRISAVPVTFTLDIPAGYVGIVGGWSVNGTDNGVYRAFGPGNHEVVVIDGFALLIEEEWGVAEWDFRIGQAEKEGWAHGTIEPLAW